MITLRYKKLSNQAFAPVISQAGSIGYDLASAKEVVVVPSMGKALIPTDLAIELPVGHYGRIAPRSGISWNHHTIISAGVIDPGYSGNISVVIFNHGSEELVINYGDRVAQLILEKASVFDTEEVMSVYENNPHERGVSGFGSTGTNQTVLSEANI